MFVFPDEIAGLLNEILGKGDCFVSLHLADPGSDGQAGWEVAAPGYVRAKVPQAVFNRAYRNEAEDTVVENAEAIVFPVALGPRRAPTITHVGLWKSEAGTEPAEFIKRWALDPPLEVEPDQKPRVPSGAIQFTFKRVF